MGNPEEAENAPGTVPLAGQENPEFSNIEQPPPAYGSYEASPQPGVSYGQPPITTQNPTAPATVIVQPTVVPQFYGRVPARVQCQFCNEMTLTHTEYENGLGTWLIFGGLCCFGCWCGCCVIPFCVNDCKDVVHKCGNCNQIVHKTPLIS